MVDVVFFIIYMIFVWQGTNPLKLFSKGKMVVIGVLLVAEMSLFIFTFLQLSSVSILENWRANIKEHNILFLYLMGFACNLYIYGTFLFYGICKIQATTIMAGEKEVQFEKMIEEPSRANELLP